MNNCNSLVGMSTFTFTYSESDESEYESHFENENEEEIDEEMDAKEDVDNQRMLQKIVNQESKFFNDEYDIIFKQEDFSNSNYSYLMGKDHVEDISVEINAVEKLFHKQLVKVVPNLIDSIINETKKDFWDIELRDLFGIFFNEEFFLDFFKIAKKNNYVISLKDIRSNFLNVIFSCCSHQCSPKCLKQHYNEKIKLNKFDEIYGIFEMGDLGLKSDKFHSENSMDDILGYFKKLISLSNKIVPVEGLMLQFDKNVMNFRSNNKAVVFPLKVISSRKKKHDATVYFLIDVTLGIPLGIEVRVEHQNLTEVFTDLTAFIKCYSIISLDDYSEAVSIIQKKLDDDKKWKFFGKTQALDSKPFFVSNANYEKKFKKKCFSIPSTGAPVSLLARDDTKRFPQTNEVFFQLTRHGHLKGFSQIITNISEFLNVFNVTRKEGKNKYGLQECDVIFNEVYEAVTRKKGSQWQELHRGRMTSSVCFKFVEIFRKYKEDFHNLYPNLEATYSSSEVHSLSSPAQLDDEMVIQIMDLPTEEKYNIDEFKHIQSKEKARDLFNTLSLNQIRNLDSTYKPGICFLKTEQLKVIARAKKMTGYSILTKQQLFKRVLAKKYIEEEKVESRRTLNDVLRASLFNASYLKPIEKTEKIDGWNWKREKIPEIVNQLQHTTFISSEAVFIKIFPHVLKIPGFLIRKDSTVIGDNPDGVGFLNMLSYKGPHGRKLSGGINWSSENLNFKIFDFNRKKFARNSSQQEVNVIDFSLESKVEVYNGNKNSTFQRGNRNKRSKHGHCNPNNYESIIANVIETCDDKCCSYKEGTYTLDLKSCMKDFDGDEEKAAEILENYRKEVLEDHNIFTPSFKNEINCLIENFNNIRTFHTKIGVGEKGNKLFMGLVRERKHRFEIIHHLSVVGSKFSFFIVSSLNEVIFVLLVEAGETLRKECRNFYNDIYRNFLGPFRSHKLDPHIGFNLTVEERKSLQKDLEEINSKSINEAISKANNFRASRAANEEKYGCRVISAINVHSELVEDDLDSENLRYYWEKVEKKNGIIDIGGNFHLADLSGLGCFAEGYESFVINQTMRMNELLTMVTLITSFAVGAGDNITPLLVSLSDRRSKLFDNSSTQLLIPFLSLFDTKKTRSQLFVLNVLLRCLIIYRILQTLNASRVLSMGNMNKWNNRIFTKLLENCSFKSFRKNMKWIINENQTDCNEDPNKQNDKFMCVESFREFFIFLCKEEIASDLVSHVDNISNVNSSMQFRRDVFTSGKSEMTVDEAKKRMAERFPEEFLKTECKKDGTAITKVNILSLKLHRIYEFFNDTELGKSVRFGNIHEHETVKSHRRVVCTFCLFKFNQNLKFSELEQKSQEEKEDELNKVFSKRNLHFHRGKMDVCLVCRVPFCSQVCFSKFHSLNELPTEWKKYYQRLPGKRKEK